MNLSKNFTLKEMTKSESAVRLGIDNTPNKEHIAALNSLCENVLQKIREYYDKPVMVTSGYRSPALCEAIGSSKKSQHAKGEAADFEINSIDNKELAYFIAGNLDFDQLILEYYEEGDPNSGWVHCSFTKGNNNRRQILRTSKDDKGKLIYIPGLDI